MTSQVEVLAVGGLTTIQDRGRLGWAHLGVPRAGAMDAAAAALANRLVGNTGGDGNAALIEITLGGLTLRNHGVGRWAVLTGAAAPATLSDLRPGRSTATDIRRAVAWNTPWWWPTGVVLELGQANVGLRSYLAVGGGVAVERVLGSASYDSLSGLGPKPLRPGQFIALGESPGSGEGAGVGAELIPVGVQSDAEAPAVAVRWGPREEWFVPGSGADLTGQAWQVDPASNRVGIRLLGRPIRRQVDGELVSEPMVLGAIQIPPNGQPIVFMADHPPTGGYPVIGVVDPASLAVMAQRRPGEFVRFRSASVLGRPQQMSAPGQQGIERSQIGR